MKTDMNVLVSGASITGLSSAYWLNKIGYTVTIVEIASELRKGGTAVDLMGDTVNILRRMGIFDQIKANRLGLNAFEFKNADDITEGSIAVLDEGVECPDDEFEIERDKFIRILFDLVKEDVEFIFHNSIVALEETNDGINVIFKDGAPRTFDLVIGCDGIHSAVRRLAFGKEAEYTHFLGLYSSVTIVDRLLVKPDTTQLYSVPGKSVMLNGYNGKSDIIFMFASESEIPYDYRDEAQQQSIILAQFAGQSWRVAELWEAVKHANNFYFDKLCQIRMPSWTKGRVALVGDAAYCPSPAAGRGGSLAMDGAASLADALQKHAGDYELAFQEYNNTLRPFIEAVQADAVNFALEMMVPRTEEDIRNRNLGTVEFGRDQALSGKE